MLRGTSISWNLLNQPEISCARWYNSNGTEYPAHTHEQREWLIVYKGSINVTVDGQDEVRLLPGMSMTIEPNVKHSAQVLEDCWFIAIAVPKSEDWPHE
jgi:quercetin dioxygenase-like cupin family protein